MLLTPRFFLYFRIRVVVGILNKHDIINVVEICQSFTADLIRGPLAAIRPLYI